MKPALSQVCSLDAPFEKDVEDYAAGGMPGDRAVARQARHVSRQAHPKPTCGDCSTEHGMAAPVASFQGGLLASQGELRKQHWERFRAAAGAAAAQLGIGTLVVAGDIAGPLDQQDLERVQVSLGQAAELAGQHGVRLALEFQARAAFANNLQTAAALVAEVGSPHLGICLDAFHYYIGPSKAEDLGYLTAENLFHVQLCDLAGVAREFATDADRILPGDGDIQLGAAGRRGCARSATAGYVSVELMNPQIWRIAPRQFGEIAMTALRKVLGQASMGPRSTAE